MMSETITQHVQKNDGDAQRREQYETNLPWFESPFFGKLLAQSHLDEQMQQKIQAFAEEGFLILDLQIEGFDAMVEDIITNLKEHYEEGSARVQDAWKFNSSVKRLATHPEILKLLKTFYRKDPIPFQTLNFQRGTEQRTHSDCLHFQSIPHGFMCGVWIALEDVHADNGPLHYYPKSHRLPFYDLHAIGLTPTGFKDIRSLYLQYEDFIQELVKAHRLEKREVNLKKGQVLIWAANLLHGGSPIKKPGSSRFSQVTHYYFSDCLYYTPMHSDPFLGNIAWREIVDVTTNRPVISFYNGKKVNLKIKSLKSKIVNKSKRFLTSFRRG